MDNIFQQLADKSSLLTDKEQELIRHSIAVLFDKTFLLRSENRKEYNCIVSHEDTIVKPILSILGLSLDIIGSDGVIGIKDVEGHFKKESFGRRQIIMLLVLRDLYTEKLRDDLGSDNVHTTRGEIDERLNSYDLRNVKNSMDELLRKFQRHNLIKVIDGDGIIIHPSIKLGADDEGIRECFEKLKEKALKNGKSADDESEDNIDDKEDDENAD